MRILFALSSASLLACSPPFATRCEVDAGPAEPQYDVQFRFINLGREAVTVKLEGEESGHPVQPMESVLKTGHVTLIKQRGTVEARNFLPDGGREPVTLPFEFDTNTDEPVTFVLKDTTPARISMNVTVGKQTQGATFGEKVNAGLAGVEFEGGIDVTGDCLADFGSTTGAAAQLGLRDDSTPYDCASTAERDFTAPFGVDADASPYLVHAKNGGVQVAWVRKVNAGLHSAGGALAQGAPRTMPGGSVISAAVSSLYVLNASGSGMPATVSIDGVEVVQGLASGALVRVKSSVAAAAQRKGLVTASVVAGANTGTVELGTLDEHTLLVVSENLSSSASVMKGGHETALNSIRNMRLQIAFGTTIGIESAACVAVYQGDDTCVMGKAVSSLAGGSAPAAQASYAATGRLLYPPSTTPAQGTTMRFTVEELGVVARRFQWASPPGLTPVADKASGGFAIVAAGTSLDATALDQRALFFVDTTHSPWTVQSSLSR